MTTVGINGGSSLCELGPREDVSSFFACLNNYVLRDSNEDYGLIADRLYRRFLRLEELDPASVQMDRIVEAFSRVQSNQVDWQVLGVDIHTTRLDLDEISLAGVYKKYFELFYHCVESARLNYEEFSSYPGYRYEPVRILITDQPWFLVEHQRNLEDYESLRGHPFWQAG